jgi:large subunit ribosomal protein L4
MATIDIVNWSNEKVGTVDLPAAVFEYPYRKHLVWAAVKAYLAGLHRGTHKTKVRSEVAGSGKKPFRQKGTGRARQGGSRPPIHRHGGTAHGPVPRSYAEKISVREKKNALKSVLSRKLAEERLIVLESLSLEAPKTKELIRRLSGLGIEGRALLVDSRENEPLERAARNIRNVKHVDPLAVNCHDVLYHGYMVTTPESLSRVARILES